MSLRIGLLWPQTSGKWTAGSLYFENLLTSIRLADCSDVEVTVIEPEDGGFAALADRFAGVEVQRYQQEERIDTTAGAAARVVKRKLGLADKAMRDAVERSGAQVVFGDAHHMTRYSVPWIGWIPDFQHRVMPEFFDSAEVASRDAVYGRMAREAAAVLLSSEDARHDFERFTPELAAKARVAPFVSLMADDVFEVDGSQTVAAYNIDRPYVIVPNQWWRHKDHETAIRAAAILADSGTEVHWVFTGALSDYRDPGHVSALLQLIAKLGLNDRMHLLGLLPRMEQLQLMRKAECVVQPSLFEGWSTVVEDAKTLGQRLVVSDLAVHVEQDPPSAIFFTRQSAEDLARAVDEMLSGACERVDETAARAASFERAKVFGLRFVEVCREAAEAR